MTTRAAEKRMQKGVLGVARKGLVVLALMAMWVPVGLFSQARTNQGAAEPAAPVKQEAPKANLAPGDAGGTGLAVDTKTYVLGPEDIIFISVWREDTLSHQYGIRPDGKITV